MAAVALVATLIGGAGGASGASPLQAGGTVSGQLTIGHTLVVRLTVRQTQGWQHVQTVDVGLELRRRPLDVLRFTPTATILEILGYPPPARLGQTGLLLGSYFRIDPSKVTLSARGTTLHITAPISLLANPPAGARMTLAATDDLGSRIGPNPLTPPVTQSKGFSFGVLVLAIALALFLGGFVGNIVTTRRRPAPRPSIYGAVQRRLEQEKTKA